MAARARQLSFGNPIYRYPRVESTQALARELAEAGAPEGTAILAEEQTGGRGRLGNSFFSPPGGLYVSLLLRPSLPPSRAPLIGLAAGLAVAETTAALTGLRPLLKWPNDVLLDGRKVSGLLVELVGGAAILGIGINVNVPPDAFPANLRATATSLLAASGREIPLDDLLAALLDALEIGYRRLLSEGELSLIEAWRSAPNMLGHTVRVSSSHETLEGTADDLDRDGALLLRLADGSLRRIVAADVHLLPS